MWYFRFQLYCACILIAGTSAQWQKSKTFDKWQSKEKLYCKPEAFLHDYITSGNVDEPMENQWKQARVGERVGLHEICLQPNGLPLTRKCLFNRTQGVAEWENITDWRRPRCMRTTHEYIQSDDLNRLHNDILEKKRPINDTRHRHEVAFSLANILGKSDFKLLPADVYLSSEILKSLAAEAKDRELMQDILIVSNKLISSDVNVLRLSAMLNATNSYLETFENYVNSLAATTVGSERCGRTLWTKLQVTRPGGNIVEMIDNSYLGVSQHFSPNLSIFYINPACTNVTGIAVYSSNVKHGKHELQKSLGDFQYRYIYMNESSTDLLHEADLQLAAYFPTQLWRYISTYRAVNEGEPLIVLKVYAHDSLFVETATVRSCKPFSKVLSISIPGLENVKFPENLPFILRNENFGKSSQDPNGNGCGYWNYSTWVSDGVQTATNNSPNEGLILCGTRHLTQFSFLLGGTYRVNDISDDILITPMSLRALDIISVIGCTLSLVGLLGIWLTAALFKSWRALSSTKVLLNMCVVLTLQMILFLFVNTNDMSEHLVLDEEYIDCIVLGAFLQYTILVLFSWMLIVAFLQFQRYVIVIGVERPPHYILKAAIAAWGFPLIPTLLVVFITPESYVPSVQEVHTNTGVCYPSGYALAIGVILPITLIIITNLTIFIYVLYSISHTLNQSMQRKEKKMVKKQIRLSVLLFFLLGLSWIFGLFAFISGGIIFSFLFCLTATLQGFVLFIYFVILDENARNKWLQLLFPKSYRKSKTPRSTTEAQSILATTSATQSTEHAENS